MALTGNATETGAASFISNVTPTTLVTNSQGAGKILRIDKLLIINMDTAANVTLELYKVPSGGAISGDDFKIVKARNIGPSNGTTGTDDIREAAGLILDNGDSLRALAGTASKLKFDLGYWAES